MRSNYFQIIKFKKNQILNKKFGNSPRTSITSYFILTIIVIKYYS